MNTNIKRGNLFYADLSPVIGSEQGGIRPVLIIQNNIGNQFSPTVIVAAITSQTTKNRIPTHIVVNSDIIPKDSIVLLEQIRTIDKDRLKQYIGQLDEQYMRQIDKALLISVGLNDRHKDEIELTLCPTCAHQFYESSQHFIKRTKPLQRVKERCTYCNVRMGYDFTITHKN
ncbi:type II toxin-antitoxin system PemK/MazF family toxin [Paludicola sp. MB14-C6]|uniref:type II toxin-antitoxin system PemK/MazF family toxin n=1 Tax=Paludihabitans sp. MB14-C6 TaxID=3070656 RepID=UPI0027DBA565|nr:type II toxin-antitoxin system PemK/MazF family toxin [Paludicola sp. MB14-C6]WMJ22927.1 type II toxin-antitoxin system PemK/MazF family toxin [Paludicola sp. MB14-C6]